VVARSRAPSRASCSCDVGAIARDAAAGIPRPMDAGAGSAARRDVMVVVVFDVVFIGISFIVESCFLRSWSIS
jgi:hypothetical protein